MTAFAQNLDNNLALTLNSRGRLNLTIQRDEVICTALKLRNRIALFLGEWFADTRIGIPYFQVVFVKNPDLAAIRTLFRKVVLSVPGIVSVQSLTLSYDSRTRRLSWNFVATATGQRTITGGSHAPFIVDGKDISSSLAATGNTL